MPTRRPACTILAGPNGSGKSTLFEVLDPTGPFLNADRAAKLINPEHPEAASFAAGRSILRELASAIGERRDFVYETTLSSNQPLDLMRRARGAGYSVGLIFVVLANADLNVKRVAQRVARGGHDIPEPIIRRRHGRAITRFGQAIPLADEIAVLENTGDRPKVLLRINDRTVREDHFDRTETVHATLWEIVASALGS